MGWIKTVFGPTGPQSLADEEFVDLREHEGGNGAVSTWIRVGEVTRVEDLKTLSTHVYDGHILILDFGAIAGDEIALKRVMNELKRIATDVGGDLAGLGATTLVVSPGGIRVDRNRIKSSA